MPLRFSDILTLARVPNLPGVCTNVLAAWTLAGAVPGGRLAAVLVGAVLLYAAGCTLNDAFDAKWDAHHRPDRLIPSGSVSPRRVWILGWTELAAGLGILMAVGSLWWWAPFLLAGAIVFYDWRHKESPWSVVTMASCRWLLWVTAGAAAMAGQTDASPGLWITGGGIVFGHILVLSAVARGEADPTAEIRRFRWLVLLPPGLCGLAAFCSGFPDPGGRIAGAGVGLLAAIALVLYGGRRFRHPGPWVAALLAAVPLLDALIIWCLGPAGERWGQVAVCAAAWPVCRLLQRKFAST